MYRYPLFLLFFSIIIWSGCNNDDDSDCAPPLYNWNTPVFESQGNWLWVTDESGNIVARSEASSQSSNELQLDDCVEHPQLNLLQIGSVLGPDNTGRTVFNITTILNAPDGLTWDTLPQPKPTEWEVAVNGITSLEELLWPADSKVLFSGDVFIDPAADLLSFALQVPDSSPVYATIKANGEASPRYIWVDSAGLGSFAFNYDNLPSPAERGPIMLPNTSNWRYRLFGQSETGEAVIDYASMPDLVSNSFTVSLPTTLVNGFRLLAQEENTFEGLPYSANRFNKIVNSMPESIPASATQIDFERSGDTLSISTVNAPPNLIVLKIIDYKGDGPWLDWTIIGAPEDFEQLILPGWPEVFANNRLGLLGENRQSVALVSARTYDTRPEIGQIIDALASKDTLWEANQGLLERTKAFFFEP